ncbi:MAG: CAP domain-containing protein [Polyangiaceae bacterium]|nr:CAP domain-containing protein [Polyangiaceae bacterium]
MYKLVVHFGYSGKPPRCPGKLCYPPEMHSRTSVFGRASLAGLLLVIGCSSEGDGTGQTPALMTTGGSNNTGGSPSPSNTGGRSGQTGGASSSGGTPSSSSLEPAPLTGITAAHNRVRADAIPAPGTPLAPLTWDSSIAATAQQWADGCMFKHSQGKYGENIYATTGSASGQKVVDSWASESTDYTYANNSCAPQKACGHYTQIVWAKSLRLGCAVKQCSQNSPFSSSATWEFWVCNYDPPGNYVGQKPY